MSVKCRAIVSPDVRRWLAALALASSISVAGPRLAYAEATPAAKALAEALFQEGRSLARQQKWQDACPKFAASQEQDPASGTLLRLGECYEKLGKTASAWVAYDEAMGLANREGNPARVSKAQQRKVELEPTLSKLTLVVSSEALGIEGLTLTRDGMKIAPAAYGVPMPIDPGVIKVNVAAPGHQTSTFEITLNPSGDHKTLHIPLPEAEPRRVPERVPKPVSEPKAQPVTPPVKRPDSGMGVRRQLGVALASASIAAVGVSVGLGSHALALARDATSLCPGGACSGDTLYKLYSDKADESRRFGIAAEVLVSSGIIFMGATAAVLLWPSSDAGAGSPPTALRLAPYASLYKDAPTLGVQGSF